MRVRIARWVVVAAFAAGLVPALQAPTNRAAAATITSCEWMGEPLGSDGFTSKAEREWLDKAIAAGDWPSIRWAVWEGLDVQRLKGTRWFEVAVRERRNVELLHAAARDDRKAVKSLIARGADVNANAHADDWFTPLIAATRCAGPEMVALLIAHGSDVNVEVEQAGDALHYGAHVTALIFAAQSGDAEIVRLLLDAGARADVQITVMPYDPEDLSKGEPGQTPLLMNVEANIARLLLEHGADPNRTNFLGESALMGAAAAGKSDTCEILLRHGADRSLRDRDNMSASDRARRRGHPETARLIDEWRG